MVDSIKTMCYNRNSTAKNGEKAKKENKKADKTKPIGKEKEFFLRKKQRKRTLKTED